MPINKVLPQKVSIFEVGARDGLQNERSVPLKDKVTLIENLANAGLNRIEAGSFVSPKWVPQMADSLEIFKQIKRNHNVSYSALTPNLQGFEAAINANVDEVAIFASASETFSQRNINCSIEESIERFIPVINEARKHQIPVRGYLSCTLGCPYQGKVPLMEVVRVAELLYQLGIYELSLGDTIGVGTPNQAVKMVEAISHKVPIDKLALHFHDTYGQALANILACLETGVSVVDSSIAGLGGCPYAKGASGNLATEDLVYMLNGLGIETGVDLKKLVIAGHKINRSLNKRSQSKVALAMG